MWQLRGFSIHTSYQNWIAHHEARGMAESTKKFASENDPPWLSFITPVYNTPPEVLRAMLDSLWVQAGGWELCAADASDSGADASQVLAEYAQIDSRIRVLRLSGNQGISGNSNQAIAMAQGEYLALLDHDDLLAPNMVAEVHALVAAHPDADIIYYDEDKLSADGQERREPWFKPHAWSPEMLISANYLMHSVVRRRLAESVGLFDARMDGAQDWDLMLRCSEQTQAIYHIPKVLYHWRQLAGSTAAEDTAKPWVFESQRRALRAHLQRQGISQPELKRQPHSYQALWTVPPAKVSVVVTTRNVDRALRCCLASLPQEAGLLQIQVVVVNKNRQRVGKALPSQRSQEAVAIKIVQATACSEAAARNRGAREAQGDLLLFFAEDLQAQTEGWLQELARWAQRPSIGAIGAKLHFANKRVYHAGVLLEADGHHPCFVYQGSYDSYMGIFGGTNWYRNFQAVSGECLMLRREVFWSVGGFNEEPPAAHTSAENMAVDLCLRLGAEGLRIMYTPFASFWLPAWHHQRRARRSVSHAGQDDPYGNPSLCFSDVVPYLADPSALLQTMRQDDLS